MKTEVKYLLSIKHNIFTFFYFITKLCIYIFIVNGTVISDNSTNYNNLIIILCMCRYTFYFNLF